MLLFHHNSFKLKLLMTRNLVFLCKSETIREFWTVYSHKVFQHSKGTFPEDNRRRFRVLHFFHNATFSLAFFQNDVLIFKICWTKTSDIHLRFTSEYFSLSSEFKYNVFLSSQEKRNSVVYTWDELFARKSKEGNETNLFFDILFNRFRSFDLI